MDKKFKRYSTDGQWEDSSNIMTKVICPFCGATLEIAYIPDNTAGIIYCPHCGQAL